VKESLAVIDPIHDPVPEVVVQLRFDLWLALRIDPC
jgi:hypothetical protein